MIATVLIIIPLAFTGLCFTTAFIQAPSAAWRRLILLALGLCAGLVSIVMSDLLNLSLPDYFSYAFIGLIIGAVIGTIYAVGSALNEKFQDNGGDDPYAIENLNSGGLPAHLDSKDPLLIRRMDNEYYIKPPSIIAQLEQESPSTGWRVGRGRQAEDIVDQVKYGDISKEAAYERVIDLVGRQRADDVYSKLFGGDNDGG